jgi:hypothetical protein
VDEQTRIPREGVLSDIGAVELAVHLHRGREGQHHPEGDRDQPERRGGHAARMQQDQRPYRRGREEHRRAQPAPRGGAERAGAFRPGQEGLELGSPDRGRDSSVRRECLPPVERRRELGDCRLARGDLARRGRVEQPAVHGVSACRGRGGTEPLDQRGAPEQIQVERVGMMLQAAGGFLGGRQAVPRAIDARECELVDREQRFVPLGAVLDARMPDHEPGEGEQQHDPRDQESRRKRRRARVRRIDDRESAGNERRQPQARDAFGRAPFRGGVCRMCRGSLLVMRDHARALCALMFSRR